MKKTCLLLVMCVGMVVPAFATTVNLVKNAQFPGAVLTTGILVKATNVGPVADVLPVTVNGVPFDTDMSNISGGQGAGNNFPAGRYYKDPNVPDLFNMLNTWKWDAATYGDDLVLTFGNLEVGVEHRIQLFTGMGWPWAKYRVVGPDNVAQKVEYAWPATGAVWDGVHVVKFTWTPTTPSATFRIESIPVDGSGKADFMGYALFDTGSDPFLARSASPYKGQTEVDYNDTILTWQPGPSSDAIKHNIYFGTGAPGNMVFVGERDLGDEQYNPGVLMLNTTYYWQIDEVKSDLTVRTGVVWSFTTAAVDQILADPNDWVANGAAAFIADPNFGTDKAISYDTDIAPYYAEITHTFDTVVDMTDGGSAALMVDSRSSKYTANDAAPIYVVLEDDSTASSRVVTSDADTAELPYYCVTTLNFALSNFTGVDVTRVKKITIGIGNPASPVTGKAGKLMVKDVRRTARRYREELYPEDLDKNQTVNVDDLLLFSEEYLFSETVTAAVDPNLTDPSSIRMCYFFNEGTGTTASDSGPVKKDILNWGDIIWETSDCPDGSCVVFDGTNRKYVWLYNAINGVEFTLAFWAKPDPVTPTNNAVIAFRKNVSDIVTDIPARATIPNSIGNISLSAGRFSPPGVLYTGVHHALPMNYAGSWHHYAFVKKSLANGGTVEMYIDGVLVERALSGSDAVLKGHDFYLGGDEWKGRYVGKLDNLILFNKPISQGEIVFLAKGAGGSVVQPPLVDIDGDGKANLADLARIASLWLENVSLWPLN